MPHTIDITGLPPDAIHAVEAFVDSLRGSATHLGNTTTSIFDLFGKAPVLRTKEDIEIQIEIERKAWDN